MGRERRKKIGREANGSREENERFGRLCNSERIVREVVGTRNDKKRSVI